MERNVSILSVVPLEELSYSKFFFDTLILLTFMVYSPQMLGAIFGAMTCTFVERFWKDEFKLSGSLWLKSICMLDFLMGAVLAYGLLTKTGAVAGIGFILFALSYGIRSVMSYSVSLMLCMFHTVYFAIGSTLAWLILHEGLFF